MTDIQADEDVRAVLGNELRLLAPDAPGPGAVMSASQGQAEEEEGGFGA